MSRKAMYALGAIMAVLYIGGLNKWHEQKKGEQI